MTTESVEPAAPPRRGVRSRPAAAVTTREAQLAGAVSAGVALGVGEIVTGLGGRNQSLVGSVGGLFIRVSGGGVARTAIRIFNTGDKPALLVGIVVLSLAAGAFIGSATRARRWVAPVGFGAFALLGVFASSRDPLASTALAFVAGMIAAGAGIVTLFALLRVAETGHLLPVPPPPTVSPGRTVVTRGAVRQTTPAGNRRAFLGWAGAAGAFGVTAALAGRALRGRSSVDAARARIRLPRPTNRAAPVGAPASEQAPGVASFDVEGLTPYIVPAGSFYRIDTALLVPQVDVASWKLSITGMVDHPLQFTYDDLLHMPQVEEAVTLSCVSNEVGGPLVGNAVWQGVRLQTLLDQAGVRSGATQVVGQSVDDFTVGFPTEVLNGGRTALVAVGMNGEPLPTVHGFPARLVVAGLYGYVSATKWLREIKLTRLEDFDAYWVPLGWSKLGPIKTESRIDVPRSGTTLRAGPTPIAGVAWAPSKGIAKVEVQVDDGPWMPTKLGSVISNDTWCEWMLTWNATPGSHRLRVRATDKTGQTQTSKEAPPDPNGASGWHTRTVKVTG